MKEFVIGAPYTTRTEVGPDNPYLILACDGVMSLLSLSRVVYHGPWSAFTFY